MKFLQVCKGLEFQRAVPGLVDLAIYCRQFAKGRSKTKQISRIKSLQRKAG